jgi:prevent-host-death family protein
VDAASHSYLVCLDSSWEVGMSGHWQVQEAKQRFSELIRCVRSDGPQFVTKHGEEIAVVIDIAEYRRLRGGTADFKEFLQSAPDFDALDIDRATAPARIPALDVDE